MSIFEQRTKPLGGLMWVLGGIMLLALGVRLWGIGFDLPYLTHSHEYHEVHRALRLGMGEFDFTRVSKGGYFYLLFVEYSVLFLVLLLTRKIASVDDFSFLYLQDPTLFWLIGRVTTALIGAATVGMVFLIARRLVGSRPALLASAILAVCPLHVELSHYISVDVPMVFLLTVALYYSINILEHRRRRDYLLAWLALALATMTKLPAIPFAVFLVLAHLMAVRERGPWRPGTLIDGNLVYGGIVFFATYTIGNPGIFSQFGNFVRLSPATNMPGTEEDLLSGYTPNLLLYYTDVLGDTLGIFLLLLSLVGFVVAALLHRRVAVIVVGFSVLYFAAICFLGKKLFYPRYVLPLIPFLLLGCAYGYAWIAQKVSSVLRPRATWIWTGVVGVLLVPLLMTSVRENIELTKTHTRILAKNWVEQNVRPGSKILTEGNPTSAYPKIPLQNLPENLRSIADTIDDKKSGKAEFLRKLAEVQEGVAFDLVMVWSKFQEWEPLGHYEDLGVEYVILNPRKHDRELDGKRKHGEELRESRFLLYDQLQASDRAELVKSFDADELSAKGHPVEIYRLAPRQPLSLPAKGTTDR